MILYVSLGALKFNYFLLTMCVAHVGLTVIIRLRVNRDNFGIRADDA